MIEIIFAIFISILEITHVRAANIWVHMYVYDNVRQRVLVAMYFDFTIERISQHGRRPRK